MIITVTTTRQPNQTEWKAGISTGWFQLSKTQILSRGHSEGRSADWLGEGTQGKRQDGFPQTSIRVARTAGDGWDQHSPLVDGVDV